MATALVTVQRVWDCRWSRFGYRLTGVSDAMQPENAWVCIREGDRRQITDTECATCLYWESDPATPAKAAVVRLALQQKSTLASR